MTWTSVPCTLYPGQPLDAAIGLIALAGDSVIESELRAMLPRARAELYVTRIPFAADLSPTAVGAMAEAVPAAARLLVPGERLDVAALGCTSGTVAIGADRLAAAVRQARPGVRFTDPVTAALHAFSALGLERVALLTPYADTVNASMHAYIESHGFDVPARATFRAAQSARLGRTPPVHIPPEAIGKAAIALGRADVDGVFISCTGLRCSPIIAAVEREIGKPVVTSNQALAWYALRLANCDASVDGFGRLLERRDRLAAPEPASPAR